MTGVSAGAKKSLRNPVGLRQLQNKSRHRPSSPPTLKSSAHNSPHCALSGYFQIPMAATSAWLRGLVQHVPSTKLRTGLSLTSLLPGSPPNLITPTLWGIKRYTLGHTSESPPLSAGLTQHRMVSGCSSESLDDSDRLFASASISLQFMRSKKWVRMTYWTKTSRMSYSEAESSNDKLTVRLESENTFSRGQTLLVNP